MTTATSRGTKAGGDEAPALVLFRQGRALLESKDYAGAIAKFEESFRLDPGGGTKLNLALAYELAGKTASAWTAFQEALRMAEGDARPDRIEEARTHLQGQETRISRLRIVVAESARVVGLQVTLDGVASGDVARETDEPVDPGSHRVEAQAPGKRPWRVEVAVADLGDRKEVTVTALEDLPAPRQASKLRPLGWIALAAGAAGLATAGATFALARSKDPGCPSTGCDASKMGQVDTYMSLRNVSTVSFWVGGALSIAGALLVARF
jgi:tetratricopeptide (TPR) repeat protein